MKQLRYWGEFLSVKDVHWRVELHQDGTHTPQEIYFPVSPLEIEWSCSGGKMGNIHKSAATLTVESDTDRRFIDLYQVEVGVVLLKVYRNGALYWCGTLDTELYEEPYSTEKHYDVTLTFADFAPLERLKWQNKGFSTFGGVVNVALSDAQIEHTSIEKHISTKLSKTSTTSITLDELSVLGANFFDEEGQPMDTYTVLEEVLKPLALHIIQKGGKIIIFDLNALYALDTQSVNWASTDANLGVDDTFSNVRLEFSTYGDSKVVNCEFDEKKTASDARFETLIMVDYASENGVWKNPEGFTFFVGQKSDTKIELFNGAKFFRIKSEYSGSDEAGIVRTAMTKHSPSGDYYKIDNLHISSPVFWEQSVVSVPIFKLSGGHVAWSQSDFLDYKLKISLDFLFDVRYNPFENKGEDNESGNCNYMETMCKVAYVPIILNLKNADGIITYHYENRGVMNSTGYVNSGRWLPGEGQLGECFLCYYASNRNGSAVSGWTKNKPIIGYFMGDLPSNITLLGDGEYIVMPPESGWIEMVVGDGVNVPMSSILPGKLKFEHERIRWVMYKGVKIEVVKRNGRQYECEDVELSATINSKAKDELDISTILGTLKTPSITAKGQILDYLHRPITRFSRAGVDDLAEKLLIGTAYSSYAKRYDTLNGTVDLLPNFCICNDRATDGKYFIISEMQSLRDNTSGLTMVEFAADNYEGIEYETV